MIALLLSDLSTVVIFQLCMAFFVDAGGEEKHSQACDAAEDKAKSKGEQRCRQIAIIVVIDDGNDQASTQTAQQAEQHIIFDAWLHMAAPDPFFQTINKNIQTCQQENSQLAAHQPDIVAAKQQL